MQVGGLEISLDPVALAEPNSVALAATPLGQQTSPTQVARRARRMPHVQAAPNSLVRSTVRC